MEKNTQGSASCSLSDIINNDIFNAILEGSAEGICITDSQDNVIAFNKAAEILTGRNAGEVLGSSCENAFQCSSTAGCCLKPGARSGLWPELSCNALRADGKAVTFRRRSRVIRDSVGRFIGNISYFADMSLKETLQKKMVVYERMASLGELSASMVHEIGNPVSVILGFSRILVQQEGEDPGGDIRSRIFKEAERCREVVDHLLDYARSASREPQRTPLVLKSVVDETLDLLSYRMKRQAVSWEVLWDVENAIVSADRGELKQVFLNVLLNALNAMDEGGVISIKGETKRNLITVGGDSLSNPRRKTKVIESIAVFIEDEGSGLGGLDPERFFAPFFSTKETGGGLGLPTCRKLLDKFGGTIRLEERASGGARVIIEIPACLDG
ncbi:MAG: hypothetical protein C0608_11285 [Deltaproteobacteria bacterium]|nr:MAG: hypothetical protein C0608_11285 [Deltaproteobacteria bacterium]